MVLRRYTTGTMPPAGSTLDCLYDLRKDASLSQQELAERSGVSRQTILRLEQGERLARPSTMRKIARALGVKPNQLIAPIKTST